MESTFETKGQGELVYNGKELIHYKVSKDILFRLSAMGHHSAILNDMIHPDVDTLVEGSEFLAKLKSGDIELGIAASVRHVFIDDYVARLSVFKTDTREGASSTWFTYNCGIGITDEVFLELCRHHNVYIDVYHGYVKNTEGSSHDDCSNL